MVEWKWRCNVQACGKMLDDEEQVMHHFFTAHKDVLVYATPVPVGELPIPVRKPAAAAAKKPRPEPEEQEEQGDDLTLEDEES